MEFTKESIRSLLRSNVMNVQFTKSDGSIRNMVCTLQENLVWPYEKKTDKVKPENDDVVAVWEIEKQAWRSFRIDSIISADIVEAPSNV